MIYIYKGDTSSECSANVDAAVYSFSEMGFYLCEGKSVFKQTQ